MSSPIFIACIFISWLCAGLVARAGFFVLVDPSAFYFSFPALCKLAADQETIVMQSFANQRPASKYTTTTTPVLYGETCSRHFCFCYGGF